MVERVSSSFTKQAEVAASEKKKTPIGDVVLIAVENYYHNSWPLGKVVEAFHDKKSLVHHAKVKVKSGTLERPIDKLSYDRTSGFYQIKQNSVMLNFVSCMPSCISLFIIVNSVSSCLVEYCVCKCFCPWLIT